MITFFLWLSKITQHLETSHRNMKRRTLEVFWKYMNISQAIAFCKLPFRVGGEYLRDRARSHVWATNRARHVGGASPVSYPELVRRRLILESASYHADPSLTEMMEACAKELECARESLVQCGFSAIFTPFHICSDVVATITAAMVKPRRCYAYSIYRQNHFGQDDDIHTRSFNIELHQCHPNDASPQQRTMFRDVRANKANLVIFPDILPQATAVLMERKMRTQAVTIFGRQARLHCGAEEIARIVGGKLISYYVYWHEGQLKIRIFKPCSTMEELAQCLEKALYERGEQWLLWHYPSLFFFNDGDCS